MISVWLAALLFFFSGAVGLIYEVAWIKVLTLQFGCSAWSVSAVIGAFMAGLGIGSYAAGFRADKLKQPFRVYALLELGIALYGMASLPLLEGSRHIVGPLYAALSGHAVLFLMARLVLAFLLLIVPTVLMGASLPLLVAGLTRREQFQKSIGFLYGINTVGAAAGVAAAGFWLLPQGGLTTTVRIAWMLGLVIAAVAWFWPVAPVASEKATPKPPSTRATPWVYVGAAFFCGFMGIAFEVCWSRLLIPVLGSSTYAFSVILFIFLIGIGLGSIVAMQPLFTGRFQRAKLGLVIATAALTGMIALYFADALPGVFIRLAALSQGNYAAFFLGQGLIVSSAIVLPTLALGIAFPLTVTALEAERGAQGEAVGRIYAINTIGSVLGSITAGFVALPLIGARNAIVVSAGLGLVAGLFLLLFDGSVSRRARFTGAAVFAGLFLITFIVPPRIDTARLQKGVFRSVMHGGSDNSTVTPDLVYYKDGAGCTVTVYRSPDNAWLKVNGKTDATARGDLETQYLVAHLPLFLKEKSDAVCVIGLGSGATVRAAAAHDVSRVDTIELEPAIVEAAGYFDSVNDNVLADPRVRLHLEDGRTFLQYEKTKYDVIVSEPSNPWIAGIGSLFTTEFYRMVKSRLAPKGLFCQWIQCYELSTETLHAMISTLADVFPHVLIFVNKGDIICLASDEPIMGNPETYAEKFARPDVRATLSRVQVTNPYELFLGFFAKFPDDRAMFESPDRNTDENLWLEYRAPLEMYAGAEPKLTPISLDVMFDRFRSIFFADQSPAAFAPRMAEALARIRPYAEFRISGMVPIVKDPEAKAAVKRFAAKGKARWDVLSVEPAELMGAETLLRNKRADMAILALNKYAAEGVNHSAVYRLLGKAYLQKENPAQAIVYYDKALACYPHDYSSLTDLGLLHALRGNFDMAEAFLTAARELDPLYPRAWIAAAMALKLQGRGAEVPALLKAARKKMPASEFKTVETSAAREIKKFGEILELIPS